MKNIENKENSGKSIVIWTQSGKSQISEKKLKEKNANDVKTFKFVTAELRY